MGHLPRGHISAGPWATTVGGATGYKPEVAATSSGGGFSDYFLRPDYQQEAVSSFLQVQALEDEYKGLYKCVCLHL
jgi:tripeptidyl-peptidase-1